MQPRIRSGIPELDQALGGGLLPGSLTLIIGATGVGKSQLGMHFFEMGVQAEGHPGAIIDLSSRGDSQNHHGYAARMFQRRLNFASLQSPASMDWGSGADRPPDVMNFLGYGGRRVLRSQLDSDQWHAWQSELNRRLPLLFRFVYGHLVHGTRRFIVDGIEPQTSSNDSLQLELLELIYHRMLRQEHDWLAREVYREKFRENSERVASQAYDSAESIALVLVTSKAHMLEELMTQPLADGDLAAAANTVIVLGRQWSDGEMGRGLYIAKHRGSYAAQNVLSFRIDEQGIGCS